MISQQNRKFRFRQIRKFRFQTAARATPAIPLSVDCVCRIAAGPRQDRAGVARRRVGLDGWPGCKTIPVEGMRGKCSRTISVTLLKAEVPALPRQKPAP